MHNPLSYLYKVINSERINVLLYSFLCCSFSLSPSPSPSTPILHLPLRNLDSEIERGSKKRKREEHEEYGLLTVAH